MVVVPFLQNNPSAVKLLKSYTQTNAYTTKKNKIIINKKKTKEEAENSY